MFKTSDRICIIVGNVLEIHTYLFNFMGAIIFWKMNLFLLLPRDIIYFFLTNFTFSSLYFKIIKKYYEMVWIRRIFFYSSNYIMFVIIKAQFADIHRFLL